MAQKKKNPRGKSKGTRRTGETGPASKGRQRTRKGSQGATAEPGMTDITEIEE